MSPQMCVRLDHTWETRTIVLCVLWENIKLKKEAKDVCLAQRTPQQRAKELDPWPIAKVSFCIMWCDLCILWYADHITGNISHVTHRYSGVFRISYRGGGGKFSLATSDHTKRGQTMFSYLFLWWNNFFAKGGHGPISLTTPLHWYIMLYAHVGVVVRGNLV